MFADTRYLPSLLSPGLRTDRAATALYNDLRELFVFQGAVYTMATYHTGDTGRGEGLV